MRSSTVVLAFVVDIGFSARLSAYLFEAIGDTQYQDAAELSAGFIQGHMGNGQIIIDTYNVSQCADVSGGNEYTINSGMFIEGLSVLTDLLNERNWILLYASLSCSLKPIYLWCPLQVARPSRYIGQVYEMDQ